MAVRAAWKDRFPRARFHGELQAPPGFDSLVTAGISLNGPVAVWSSRDGEAELHARNEQQPGGASFSRSAPGAPPAAALAAYGNSGVVPVTVVQVRALPVSYPHVDVLADGAFVVVGARCTWTESGPELNALAIDQDGRIFRRGCLGDGIAHLQVAGGDHLGWLLRRGRLREHGMGRSRPGAFGCWRRRGLVAWLREDLGA